MAGTVKARVARGLVATLLLGTMLAPLALAQDAFEPYVEPKTEQARDIKSLFNVTFGIAMVIFVGVEALLFYVLWKFRNNKTPPEETGARGHTTAEIVWTIIPAGILLFLGVISAGTLFELDTIPEDTDVTIVVEASRWNWKFTYPDGNYSVYRWDGTSPTTSVSAPQKYNATNGRSVNVGDLQIEEGARVRLEIVSTDVLHAVWIPEFGVKIDAVPGVTNVRWFEAPAYVEGGDNEYFFQCAEFCGRGHHAMHAKVVVAKAGSFGNGLPYPTPEPLEAPAT